MPKKSQYGNRSKTHDAKSLRVLVGAQGIPASAVDHGVLLGLTDDDHENYVHISSSRTITAQHQFSPASVLPPFTLGTNAQGQLVTGLNADQLDGLNSTDFLSPQYVVLTADTNLTGERVLTAGDGLDLSDGGAGSTVTIAVDVTDIIDTSYGLTEDTNNIRINKGNGLDFSTGALVLGLPSTLTVSTSNGVTTTSHTHAITTSSNPGAAASILASNASGYLQLTRLGIGTAPSYLLHVIGTSPQLCIGYDAANYASFGVSSGGDLTLDTVGDDILIASANTLSTDHWVSQTTGWGISYAGAGDFRSLYADEMHVKAFIADIYEALVGAIIVTKSRARISRDFTIPATSSTGTIYLEDLEGFEGSQVFATGDNIRLRVVDNSGGGLIVTDVWGTVSSYTDLSGGEQSWTFTCTDDGGVSGSVIYTGSLALDYGQSGDGVWEATVLDTAGSPYSQVTTWVTDPSNPANFTTHVRLGNLDGISGIGAEYGLWAGQGATVTDAYLLLSDTSAEIHNIPLVIADGTATRIKLDPAVPSIAVGATAPIGYVNGIGFWVGNDSGTYRMHLGDPSTEHMRWNGSSLSIFADANDYIAFDSGYITGVAGGVAMFSLGSSGAARIGSSTADHILITTSGLQMRDSSVVRGDWQTDGDIFIGSNISAAATTYFSIFANAQTYNSESVGAGDMLIGDNSASKANILWDYSVGRLLFRGGTTTQLYLDTSGALSAGGGAVTLNSSGLSLTSDNTYSFATATIVKWLIGSSAAAYIGHAWSSGTGVDVLKFQNTGYSGYNSHTHIYNQSYYGATGRESKITLEVLETTPGYSATFKLVVGPTGAYPYAALSTSLRYDEIVFTPANPTSGAAVNVYMKADKLVFQYNDGGTIRYKYLSLTGTGVTWVHTTTAP